MNDGDNWHYEQIISFSEKAVQKSAQDLNAGLWHNARLFILIRLQVGEIRALKPISGRLYKDQFKASQC
jgi:hypothetical protein